MIIFLLNLTQMFHLICKIYELSCQFAFAMQMLFTFCPDSSLYHHKLTFKISLEAFEQMLNLLWHFHARKTQHSSLLIF